MLAVITGTALQDFLEITNTRERINTPFGPPSAPIREARMGNRDAYVLARHGLQGAIGAHQVNYRANIWALKELNVSGIIATATVGGVNRELELGDLVVPDQIIDYTYGREQTFVGYTKLNHFDFTYPFTDSLRQALVGTLSEQIADDLHNKGVYGCAQGPRLETATEIERFRRDGCDLIGMTLMPEASLARELEIPYAGVCLVVNPAAGVDDAEIDFEEVSRITHDSTLSLRQHLGCAIEAFEQ